MEFLLTFVFGAATLAVVGVVAMAGFGLAMTIADEYDFSFPVTLTSGIIGGLGLPTLCYYLGRMIVGG